MRNEMEGRLKALETRNMSGYVTVSAKVCLGMGDGGLCTHVYVGMCLDVWGGRRSVDVLDSRCVSKYVLECVMVPGMCIHWSDMSTCTTLLYNLYELTCNLSRISLHVCTLFPLTEAITIVNYQGCWFCKESADCMLVCGTMGAPQLARIAG